jgi:mannose-6-phosphate isomerase-like protein (cupin superfamily)
MHRCRGILGRMADSKVDLDRALASFTELWSPKLAARLNDYEVKLVKLEGEFVWHTHDDTDELFLVIDGELTIQLRDRDVVLGPHEMYVVPRGVEHCPRAERVTSVLLLEPGGVVNTGDAGGPLTAGVQPLVRPADDGPVADAGRAW